MSADGPDLREATPLAARSTGSLLRGRVDAGAWARAFAAGGVGASVLFHAMCNLFSATLAHGYGLD